MAEKPTQLEIKGCKSPRELDSYFKFTGEQKVSALAAAASLATTAGLLAVAAIPEVSQMLNSYPALRFIHSTGIALGAVAYVPAVAVVGIAAIICIGEACGYTRTKIKSWLRQSDNKTNETEKPSHKIESGKTTINQLAQETNTPQNFYSESELEQLQQQVESLQKQIEIMKSLDETRKRIDLQQGETGKERVKTASSHKDYGIVR